MMDRCQPVLCVDMARWAKMRTKCIPERSPSVNGLAQWVAPCAAGSELDQHCGGALPLQLLGVSIAQL